MGLFSLVVVVTGGSNGVVSRLSEVPNMRIGEGLRAGESSCTAFAGWASGFMPVVFDLSMLSKENEVSCDLGGSAGFC